MGLMVGGILIMAVIYLYDPLIRHAPETIIGPKSGPALGIGFLIAVFGLILMVAGAEKN